MTRYPPPPEAAHDYEHDEWRALADEQTDWTDPRRPVFERGEWREERER